jgi:hypothetical protein
LSDTPKKKKKVVLAKAKDTKKVVVGTSGKRKVAPTASRSKKTSSTPAQSVLLFKRENYKWMFIGLGLILLGMLLMMGGSMPDANTWDPSLAYSHRRITLAPIVILTGLGMQIYAIFK